MFPRLFMTTTQHFWLWPHDRFMTRHAGNHRHFSFFSIRRNPAHASHAGPQFWPGSHCRWSRSGRDRPWIPASTQGIVHGSPGLDGNQLGRSGRSAGQTPTGRAHHRRGDTPGARSWWATGQGPNQIPVEDEQRPAGEEHRDANTDGASTVEPQHPDQHQAATQGAATRCDQGPPCQVRGPEDWRKPQGIPPSHAIGVRENPSQDLVGNGEQHAHPDTAARAPGQPCVRCSRQPEPAGTSSWDQTEQGHTGPHIGTRHRQHHRWCPLESQRSPIPAGRTGGHRVGPDLAQDGRRSRGASMDSMVALLSPHKDTAAWADQSLLAWRQLETMLGDAPRRRLSADHPHDHDRAARPPSGPAEGDTSTHAKGQATATNQAAQDRALPQQPIQRQGRQQTVGEPRLLAATPGQEARHQVQPVLQTQWWDWRTAHGLGTARGLAIMRGTRQEEASGSAWQIHTTDWHTSHPPERLRRYWMLQAGPRHGAGPHPVLPPGVLGLGNWPRLHQPDIASPSSTPQGRLHARRPQRDRSVDHSLGPRRTCHPSLLCGSTVPGLLPHHRRPRSWRHRGHQVWALCKVAEAAGRTHRPTPGSQTHRECDSPQAWGHPVLRDDEARTAGHHLRCRRVQEDLQTTSVVVQHRLGRSDSH